MSLWWVSARNLAFDFRVLLQACCGEEIEMPLIAGRKKNGANTLGVVLFCFEIFRIWSNSTVRRAFALHTATRVQSQALQIVLQACQE